MVLGSARDIRRWFRTLPRRLGRKWRDCARSHPRLTMWVIGLVVALGASAVGLETRNAFLQNVAASLTAFGVSLAFGGPLVRTLLLRQQLQQWWRKGLDDAYGRVHYFYQDLARAVLPYRSRDELQSSSKRFAARHSRPRLGVATRFFSGDVVWQIIDDRSSYIGHQLFALRGFDFPSTPRHFKAIDRYLDARLRDAGPPAIVLRALRDRDRETEQRRAWQRALAAHATLGDPLLGSPIAPTVTARVSQLKEQLDAIRHEVNVAGKESTCGTVDYHGDNQHPLALFHTASVSALRLTVLLLRDLHQAGAILLPEGIAEALVRYAELPYER